MKIIRILAVAFLILFLFGGCSEKGDYSEPNDKQLVSAVGFDNEDGMLRVSLLTVVSGQKDKSSNKTEMQSQTGNDVRQALARLSAQSPKELSLTHCGIFILGESLSAEQTDEIFKYCIDEKQVSLSAVCVTAKKASELLSVTAGEESAGYEIRDIIENTSKQFGYGGNTSVYEIQTARLQNMNLYALPRFSLKADKAVLDGMRVFVKDKPSALLNEEQSVAYSVMRNVFLGGQILSKDKVYTVESARTKITADFNGENLEIEITIRASDNAETVASMVENTVSDFDIDIFGVGNTIKEEYPSVWQKISEGYDEYYKKANITVRAEENE